MSWTESKISLLKKLYASNFSMGAIACVMRGMTRNAVIGKIYRLRQEDDGDVLLADVTRALAAADGVKPIGREVAQKVVKMPGIKVGLLDVL